MGTIAEGEAIELRGTIRPLGPSLVAPLTGEACIGHVSRARVFTNLTVVGRLVDDFRVAAVAPFLVETSSGPVLVVDAPELDLDLAFLGCPEVSGDSAEGPLTAFLATRRLERYAMSSFFEHALLRAGDAITASGVITLEPSPVLETGFRDLPTRTRLIGYGAHPLVVKL
jgi:hypothetical protein